MDSSKAMLTGYKVGDTLSAKAWIGGDGSIHLYDANALRNSLVFNLHVGADSAADNKISTLQP